MATKIGGNLKAYQHWERGSVMPSFNVLLKVARRFKISIEALLTIDLKEKKTTIQIKEDKPEILFTGFKQAGPDTKKIVCALLKIEM